MGEYNNNNGSWGVVVTTPKTVSTEYKSKLKSLMGGFGMKLKQKLVGDCDRIFATIFQHILPEVSNDLISSSEWFLDSKTLQTIPDGQILVVAHHKRVSRFMAIISTLSPDSHHEIMPDAYCRVLHRIQIREPQATKKPRIYLRPQGMVKLLSTRRGIYAINRSFYNLHIVANKVGPKEYRVDPSVENMLYTYYRDKIHGIEQRPKIIKQLSAHKGIEQFLIRHYPTQKWKDAYDHMLKTKQVGGSSSSSSKSSSEEEEDEEASPDTELDDEAIVVNTLASMRYLKNKRAREQAADKSDIVDQISISNSVVCPNCNSWINMRVANRRICVDSASSDHLIGKNVTSLDPHVGLRMLYFDGLSTGNSMSAYGDDPEHLIRDAFSNNNQL